MTPVNFIAFLLSLYLVDCHYDDERARRHRTAAGAGAGAATATTGPAGRLPAWLHRLFLAPQPYEWVDQGRERPAPPNRHEERYYYHTKQKKLMRMEAADAFGLRTPVLVLLSLLAAAAAWAAWRLASGLAALVV